MAPSLVRLAVVPFWALSLATVGSEPTLVRQVREGSWKERGLRRFYQLFFASLVRDE